MKKNIAIIIMASLLFSLSGCSKAVKTDVLPSDSLYIRKIDNIPSNYIMAMDTSSMISLENSGVVFRDFEGNEADLLEVLAKSGITHIRVRIWNDPFDSNGNGYGGGNCDIENALAIGKRAVQYGLKLIVDFHYSDFWADPSKQMVPKAWKGLAIEDKAQKLYEFTKDCLQKLKSEKVDVAMVQIGNETNNGLAGEKTRMNVIYHLMASGSKAVREVFPKALVAVHYTDPQRTDSFLDFAKKLDYYQLDYDVFVTSYYPFWHGTLDNLANVLNNIADTYGKKTMIMETSYAFTGEDFDFFPNTIGEGSAVTKNYPYTLQGQTNAILDVIDASVNKMKDCLGVSYWEGAWISVGNDSREENAKLWETYGSGWASSYARSYDPNDAGRYYGGSAVDNQAFFDSEGRPLESLKLFALCRSGNLIDRKADAIKDVSVECDINDDIVLPEQVDAIMNDGTESKIDVSWEEFSQEGLKTSGLGKYVLNGTADGLEAKLYLSLITFNYLKDHSFEDEPDKTQEPSAWKVNKLSDIKELHVEDKKLDSLDGDKHFHFWSDKPLSFELEQEVTQLTAGRYSYSISIMGGDGGDTDIYAYVKIGEQMISEPLAITSYNEWHTAEIDFEYDGNSPLTVGIHVDCTGQGSGAWGKIDDAKLNKIGE